MVQSVVMTATQQVKKLDKRENIVNAALELIAEHGFHGTSIAMVATRAGVGAGTIYRYFENKDVLITELFWELEDRIYLVISEGYSLETSISVRFFHVGKVLLQYFIDNPVQFKYLEQFFNSPYGEAIRRDRILGMKGERCVYRFLFEDGISTHEMKDFPLVVLFGLTFGPLFAVARDHVLGFIELNESLIEIIVNACWDSVKQ